MGVGAGGRRDRALSVRRTATGDTEIEQLLTGTQVSITNPPSVCVCECVCECVCGLVTAIFVGTYVWVKCLVVGRRQYCVF